MRIHEVLAHKPSHDVVTVRPDATVRELLGMLAEYNIGALVVSTDGAAVDGIVSERDIVRRLHADESVLDAAVSTIMSSQVQTCEKDATVNELMSIMTERRFRHVPVIEGGVLRGVVSIGDVVKHRIDELEAERSSLEGYITGERI